MWLKIDLGGFWQIFSNRVAKSSSGEEILFREANAFEARKPNSSDYPMSPHFYLHCDADISAGQYSGKQQVTIRLRHASVVIYLLT